MLLGTYAPASAQVSIGINLSLYPDLVEVPGYPVYYAPQLDSNFFFYDGLYWVYAQDNWYSSSWYDGPWDMVTPEFVPLFVLGSCFAIAYEWSGSILVSMTMHSIFNSLTLTALAFPEIISQ